MPSSVWAMGLCSLFMDASSELVHSVLPLFLVTTLGASMIAVGVIEGVAEGVASAMKVCSGALSDRLRRRKPLLVLGYALAACTKPMFPLATTVGWVFTARFVDRVGKGIRGAPRDALVADLVPPSSRGSAFGLRQALDSVGALAGPLLAAVLLTAFAGDIRATMWFAVVPAFAAVAVLLVWVDDPGRPTVALRTRRFVLGAVGRLPVRYWWIVVLGTIFTLARFSEAFLLLRGQSVGLSLSQIPFVMVAMNAIYAGAAYPAGVAADRVDSRVVLCLGLAVLVGADLVLASAAGPRAVFAGAALWGLHMALTQGLLSKLVADVVPSELLGIAFGVFHLASGGAAVLASALAGVLWAGYGPAVTFLAGAVFATVSAAGLLATSSKSRTE